MRWPLWLLEQLLWIAGLAVMLLASFFAVGVARTFRFGPELAAAVIYTSWIIVLLFYPGRAHPAYNPFGAAARSVWRPLARMHLLSLLGLMPLTVLGVFVRTHMTPRWFVIATVIVMLVLSYPQYDRSIDLLREAESAQWKKVH
ncbi:hypothetical protein [Terriglobus sp.]|uniref:hypothetical protein n=1 Tax=Terriglobus sp. TaxID=1889013 RepID=UPI003B000DD9